MKSLIPAISLILLFCAPLFAQTPTNNVVEAPKVLFTEKDLRNGGGIVLTPQDFYDPCRVTIEYVAEKPLTLIIKPRNNAFMGLWRHTLPAASEPRKETCDFSVHCGPSETEFRVDGGGVHEIRSLTAVKIPRSEYRPSTTIPNARRKGSPRHAQIKKTYAAAPPHPVILFGDSLTDNWRGARFAYMATNFPVVNAGICGDRIEDLLWRVEDMRELLTNNPPSVATIMIGTNNFGFESDPFAIRHGVRKLVTDLRAICPETKIILFAIPPRGFIGRKEALPFPSITNPQLLSIAWTCWWKKDDSIFFFDFSELLLDGKAIRLAYFASDRLHFSDKGYAEVVTPFVAGAIRLATAKNLPHDYMWRMARWEDYLRERRFATEWNFALEEMLACETHLAALPAHWMKVFSKLEADPDYTPEMPDEYLRQEREEGLPDSVKQKR